MKNNPSNKDTIIAFSSIKKSYEKNSKPVVDIQSLAIKKGKITSIVGQSGSGKTTFTRLVAGLEIPDSGELEIDGEVVSNDSIFIEPEHRNIGMVFQDYALFPHLSVSENVAFGLKSADKNRISEVLNIVEMSEFEDRYPHQLSGGQQQRVALARAIATKPKILILDEPFSNLDSVLKLELRNQLLKILKQIEITTLFVTHDTEDAIFISDEIVVMNSGKIAQQGIPEDIFKQPKSMYVASMFSELICLSSEDLKLFDFNSDVSKKYALRINQLSQKNTNQYTSKIVVKSCVFIGDKYRNSACLSNGKEINFLSTSFIDDTSIIGFDQEDLLEFDIKS